MSFILPPAPQPSLPVDGHAGRFAVRRIYCVGRNYAAHAREMGSDPDREPPFFFSKPADAVVADGADVPYPPRTDSLHYEAELVVAIGKTGVHVPVEGARALVFGYGVGVDLTRRDLQAASKADGRPWDTAKGFDASAPTSVLHPASQVGHPETGRIWLSVNGEVRQDSDIAAMTWSVPEILAELSTYFTLQPGDLVFTGTPDGVGPLVRGDRVETAVQGVASLAFRLT